MGIRNRKMHGIVSLLDEKHNRLLESIWRQLEQDCGLKGIQVMPIPHFSWHVAESYDFEALETTLQSIASQETPFTARTAGLGVFTGPQPVVTFALVRDANLNRLHTRIWDGCTACSEGTSSYYTQPEWIPHITLAQHDIDAQGLNCLIQNFAFQPLRWEIRVDNLAIIHQTESGVGGLKSIFPFGDWDG